MCVIVAYFMFPFYRRTLIQLLLELTMRTQQHLEHLGLILHTAPTQIHLLQAPHGPIILTTLLLPQWEGVLID